MRAHWPLPVEEELVFSGPDWLLLLLDRYDSQTCANFLMLIWRCWSVRNGVTKAGKALSVEGSVIFLTRYMQSLLSVRQQEAAMDERGKQKPQEKSWRPPPPNTLKINVDGAFNPETGGAAVGVVIRNDAGQPQEAVSLQRCRRS
ncbi:hypothetical protein HU200_038341 [Digitaria exilis]|uniref:RNase H type-1 domain-containing protein n=1 Tax=Digitaria exilis TaxID=1010633 RepID=A0A835EGE5_9POAL|nr:hypothetical protein HU200_038341 [Digitaria exilis]